MAEINWIDGALSFVLLASSLFGLFRGLIRGVFGIASVILAFLVARRYGALVGGGVSSLLGESAFSLTMGYVLAFVISLFTFSAFTYLLSRAAARVDLGAADRFGGLLFGALRGGALALLLVMTLSSLPFHRSDAWRESVLVPVFGYAMRLAVGADALSDYQSYWRFDEKHRPRLSLGGALASLSETAGADDELREQAHEILQRDGLLDSLNDEIARQSVNRNESAEQNALRLRERAREESFLQEVGEAAKKALQEPGCENGGDCPAAE